MTKESSSIDMLSIECDKHEIEIFHRKLGRKVQCLRQEKGLSQLELSYYIGFKSTSLIAGAESGYKNIKFSIEHLYKIAKVLDINVKEFFEESDEKV
ncbi:helix-turn-helix domain-containing protein [Sulfurospirillum sp.]|uniref:helix-turn-helix domain-containing protein n=1 Tax=Sulfurospirillum sp. TaxID=2053622 RepID=UPI002FDC9A4F